MATFSILAKLGLDTSTFDSKFSGAISGVKGRIASAFGAAAITAFAKSVINAADNIGDLAEQTALTTDEIQRLIAIASAKGLEFTQLQQFIFRLQGVIDTAREGKGELADLFKQLGLDPEQLAGMKTLEERIKAVMGAVDKFGDSDRVKILTMLGGAKAGPKMQGALGMIAGGGGGDAATFTSDDIELASRIKDSQSSLWRQFKVWAFREFTGGDGGQFTSSQIAEMERNRVRGPNELTGFVPPAPKTLAAFKDPAKQIALEKQIAEQIFSMKLKTLGVEEKQAELIKQRAVHERAILDLFKNGGDEESKLKARLEFLKVQEQINDLNKSDATKQPSERPLLPDINALQRIGAQATASDRATTIAERQLEVQRRIQRATEKTAQEIADAGIYNDIP